MKRLDMELEAMRARSARALYNEGEACAELEATLRRIGSDRPPARDSDDDYEAAPIGMVLHAH